MLIRDPSGKYETVKLRLEDELLLCCAWTNVNPKIRDKILYLVRNRLDWDYLLKLASRQGLMPLLHYNLNSVCPELVPENILNELKDNFNANVRKNLMLTGELIKVINLLESEGITAIPYKGPVLALMAYGNISLREFDDLDIHISKDDAIKTKELLLNYGFKLKYHVEGIDENNYLNTQREYVFISDNGILIEIQWRLPHIGFSFPTDWECLVDKKNIEKININGNLISNITAENLILILSIHCADHRWLRLQWLLDISELIKSNENIKWAKIIKKAEHLNIKRVLFINLLLSHELFGLKIPEKFLIEIQKDINVKNISKQIILRTFKDNSSNSIFEEAILRFKIREKHINGIKDCINIIFRPTNEELNKLSLPNFLFPIYYVLRVINVLKTIKYAF